MGLLTVLQVSVVASSIFLAAAYGNYPGGRALEALHKHGDRVGLSQGSRPISVHIGVEAAMTGVSRFLERGPPWKYSKKEKLNANEYRQFSFALVAPDKELSGFAQAYMQQGFDRVVPKPPFFQYGDKIKVLKRKKEGAGAAAATPSSDTPKDNTDEETFFGDV